MSRFRFVEEHRGLYEVKRLCRLVEMSRSSFYAWRSRPPCARVIRDAYLSDTIRTIYARSRRTYGAPRVHRELRHLGTRVGRKAVARLMRDEHLVGVCARKRWRRGRPDVAPAPDLVERNFDPPTKDRVWCADITEFVTGEGKLYLAGVLDLHARPLIGWAMGTSANADLVIDAFVMAFERRRPDEVIHHSDRGTQYTSFACSTRLADLEIAQSFGSTGDCFDNAAMEAFWSTLKRELAWIHRRTRWATRAELRAALFDYIECFYNRDRSQARIDYQSPFDYERKMETAA